MKKCHVLPALILLLFPTFLFANAGTPLMWANALHLYVGNAIIGIVEGLIASSFSLLSKKKKAVIFFIVLNYISMVLGVLLIFSIAKLGSQEINITIQDAKVFLAASFSFFYLATLFVEFPFVLGFFWKENRRVKKALKTTLIVNTVSYVLIFPLYWFASSATMVNELEVVTPQEIGLPSNYDLYYISKDKTELITSNLDGNSKKVVKKIENINSSDSIKAVENKNQKVDLYINNEKRVILENVSGEAPKKDEKSFKQFDDLTKYGSWKYSSGFWAISGVRGQNDEGKFFRYSIETPFLSWRPKNGTHVEKDLLIFQLGSDQIVALRHEKKQIALIARGFGPVVIKTIKEESQEKPQETPKEEKPAEDQESKS